MRDIFFAKTVTIWKKQATGLWNEKTWSPIVFENARVVKSGGYNALRSGIKDTYKIRVHIGMDGLTGEQTEILENPDEETYIQEGNHANETPNSDFFNNKSIYRIANVDKWELIPHYEVWGE